MGFTKTRGTFLGLPIIRIIVFGCILKAYIGGPLILGNYYVTQELRI